MNGSKQRKERQIMEDKENAAMTFHYWLRTLLGAETVLASDLVGFVLKYYLILEFEWDSTKSNLGIALSQDKRRYTYHVIPFYDSNWISLHSTNILSGEVCHSFRWEITLRSFHQSVNFKMGYYNADRLQDFNSKVAIGEDENSVAVDLTSQNAPKADEIYPSDVFRMDFDFKQGKCWAFYNGKSLGLVSNKLPERIVFASSATIIGTSFETTGFEMLL